jgi:hypothetical protein
MPSPRFARLSVEQLDERLVPSAVLDLTHRGAQVATAGFIARQIDALPAAQLTAVSRVDSGGVEQGYNTTAKGLDFDEKRIPRSRGITLSQVPVVTINGVAYREFILDVDQKAASPLLSVDQVRVYVAGRSDLTGYNPRTGKLAGHAPVFDLDAKRDVSLVLNARLNRGRGSGDLSLLIPDSAFAGADPKSFVYLYSQMGATRGASANGGFEQWSVRPAPAPTTTPTPPATSSLSGYVFADNGQDGVRDDTDQGLFGVQILLQGVDAQGHAVSLKTTTDNNGFYQFTGLSAGTYTITEVQPSDPSLVDGLDYAGTVNGTPSGSPSDDSTLDYIGGIALGSNQQGVNYNFTEQIVRAD